MAIALAAQLVAVFAWYLHRCGPKVGGLKTFTLNSCRAFIHTFVVAPIRVWLARCERVARRPTLYESDGVIGIGLSCGVETRG